MSTQALAYMTLVGKPAMGTLCLSSTELRVMPNQPTQSLIIAKVTATALPCGRSRCPLGGTMLTTAQVALISDWIADGALNN